MAFSPLQAIRAFATSAPGRSISKPLSTVQKGTAFEERGLKLLHDHLSMSLTRVGGKSDGGVDLQGWWWLPPLIDLTGVPLPSSSSGHEHGERRRLRVFVQCKAEKKKFSPNYVREMEGVLHRYLAHATVPKTESGGPAYPLVALLLSESAFTSATLLRAQSSPVPFLLLHLPPAGAQTEGESDSTSPGSLFWNPALGSHRGLLGGQIEVRWERATGAVGRPGLWWQGKRLQSWTPDGVTGADEDFEVPGVDIV
ncbi:hypothetical protein FIBSPDRAFT_874846 [Athelia psychrophila]|uniref:Required for respiratory growth protein 7, mitochondrial n=1 Tax=Athelia psychrophila TaxID=1759441 RepID=A0A165X1A4_9AGAM|nr:hypothetical protein FIBSPDRAFT_874846 [Fibularhizoctonia sp. CBS 109695]